MIPFVLVTAVYRLFLTRRGVCCNFIECNRADRLIFDGSGIVILIMIIVINHFNWNCNNYAEG